MFDFLRLALKPNRTPEVCTHHTLFNFSVNFHCSKSADRLSLQAASTDSFRLPIRPKCSVIQHLDAYLVSLSSTDEDFQTDAND